jgi:recombinational DNA repair protein RecR
VLSHVLGGKISPIDRSVLSQLNIPTLVSKIKGVLLPKLFLRLLNSTMETIRPFISTETKSPRYRYSFRLLHTCGIAVGDELE